MKHKRRAQSPFIIGLTGSIGMGKSTAARILKSFGFPVHSADKAAHESIKRGGKAVDAVAKLFPEALRRGAIDRAIVGRAVFDKPPLLKKLEKILHPHVRTAERAFLAEARRKKAKVAVLEIPLLFETKAEKRCDTVLCVTAPRDVQQARVMKRPGMTKARYRAILSQQMPDGEKRRRADFVVHTDKGLADTRRQLAKIAKRIKDGKI